MQNTLEHSIRERAYHLWLADGCQGEAERHWLAAEREMLATAAATIDVSAGVAAREVPVAAGKKKRVTKKAAKAA
jgi:hypothetical protein